MENEEIVLSADDFSFVNYTASPVIQKVKYTLYQLKIQKRITTYDLWDCPLQ